MNTLGLLSLCVFIHIIHPTRGQTAGSIELDFPQKRMTQRLSKPGSNSIIVAMDGNDPASWTMNIKVSFGGAAIDVDSSGALEALYFLGQISKIEKIEDKNGLFFVYRKKRWRSFGSCVRMFLLE